MFGFRGEIYMPIPKPSLILLELILQTHHLPCMSVESSKNKHLGRPIEFYTVVICAVPLG